MEKILPQQRLLLEMLKMSGNIAVPDSDNGTVLYRTLGECRDSGWIILTPFGAGFNKAEITVTGRDMCKDRRSATSNSPSEDRRRSSVS